MPRGRPVGSTHGSIRRPHWQPCEWRPEYDRVIGYSALGLSNEEVAKKVGYTKEHVSSILNTDRGKEFMREIQAKLRDQMAINIPEALVKSAEKAAERIQRVLENDELFEKSPFQVVGVGMDVLKGLRHLQTGPTAPAPSTTNIGTVVITPQQHSDILDGLQMVAEIRATRQLREKNDATGTDG